MIEKSRGIVLHTLKHSDSGIISQIFTEGHGRLSFMVRGVNSRKGSTRKVYFQPLQILDIEFYYRESRDLQNIKEINSAYNFSSIPYEIKRNTVALFISEILYRSLPEKEPNKELFNYLSESIRYFDTTNNTSANFHLGFLVGFARFLGIAPQTVSTSEINYFDMQNGIFTRNIPVHGLYFDTDQSEIFSLFLKSSIEECELIMLSGNIRNRFLKNMLNYFSLHLPGIKNIKSLDILIELFG